MKVSYTKFDAGDGGRAYVRRLFLERASDVPGVISSLEEGRGRTLYDGLWEFLNEWSESWCLDADWIRRSAYELIETWPEEEGPYLTHAGNCFAFMPPEIPAYYYNLMERKQYKKMVDSIIDEYCEASEQGLTGAKNMDDVKRDVDWTVRFQVQKQEWSEIAEKDHVEPDAVRKAVNRILNLVELKSGPFSVVGN